MFKSSREHDVKMRYLAVSCFLRLVHVDQKDRVAASETVASFVFKKGPWRARLIRVWANVFVETGAVPVSQQGKHTKVQSLMCDESFRGRCLEHLNTLPSGSVTAPDLKNFVNNTLMPEMGISKGIAIKTARLTLAVVS